MLAAAHVRCPPGKQSQVDSCWRRDDPPSQRMPPLGCAHISIMAVTSNLSHHRLVPTSAGQLASVTGGAEPFGHGQARAARYPLAGSRSDPDHDAGGRGAERVEVVPVAVAGKRDRVSTPVRSVLQNFHWPRSAGRDIRGMRSDVRLAGCPLGQCVHLPQRLTGLEHGR